MNKYIDNSDRRHRPEATPQWAMSCFLDRALDLSNMQAGQFAVAYGLTSLCCKLSEIMDRIDKEEVG